MDTEVEYKNVLKEKEEADKLAYKQALLYNPNLTYEEFLQNKPVTFILIEEPKPSKALLEFAKKYL